MKNSSQLNLMESKVCGPFYWQTLTELCTSHVQKHDLFLRLSGFPTCLCLGSCGKVLHFSELNLSTLLHTAKMTGKHFDKLSPEKRCLNVTLWFQQTRTLTLNSSVLYCVTLRPVIFLLTRQREALPGVTQ